MLPQVEMSHAGRLRDPLPPPVVVCQPVRKKHCFKMPKFHMPKMSFCHKRAACAPAPVCQTAWPAQQSVWPAAQEATPAAQATSAPQT